MPPTAVPLPDRVGVSPFSRAKSKASCTNPYTVLVPIEALSVASVPTHANRKAVTRLPTPVDQVIAAPLMKPAPPGGRKYEGVAERPLSS